MVSLHRLTAWLVQIVTLILAIPASAQVDWLNLTGVPNPFYDANFNWSGGQAPLAHEQARFQQIGTYEVWWDQATPLVRPEVGAVQVRSLDLGLGMPIVTFANQDGIASHRLVVNGIAGSAGIQISSGELTIRGLHLEDRSGLIELESFGTLRLDGRGLPTEVSTTGVLSVGRFGSPVHLEVSNSARLRAATSQIAERSGGLGMISISNGATWQAGNLSVGTGGAQFSVQAADVECSSLTLGNQPLSTRSTLTVDGTSARWVVSGDLLARSSVTFNIQNGALFRNQNATFAGARAEITLTGNGTRWETPGNLRFESLSQSSLRIETGAQVIVGGTTSLNSQAAVQLQGGRFDFGTTSLAEFSRIQGTAGTLAGQVLHAGNTAIDSLVPLQNPAISLGEVQLVNSGLLYGHGALRCALRNATTGEVEIGAGERMTFRGLSNFNQGEINNFGGLVRFDGQLTNESTGFMAGRGQFIANGGWTNRGVMSFSGGFSDVLGDTLLEGAGAIITTGGATTTFFDDVHHQGAEIRTSAGSSTVFLGQLSGAGRFTGTGTVYIEGDLRPGNSPDIVFFDGDVQFGSRSLLTIELGGTRLGEFDQLVIAGDVRLEGGLLVSLIGGHELATGNSYLMMDIGGTRWGTFGGLGEGAWVGNFLGRDLFITYAAGDGNDIALFSAVPEPWVAPLLLLGSIPWAGCGRRRRIDVTP